MSEFHHHDLDRTEANRLAAEMMVERDEAIAALRGIMNLFRDLKFCVYKRGGGMTNADQDLIDETFAYARTVLKGKP